MTTQETERVIAVMQAFVDGKQIQVRHRHDDPIWHNVRHACGITPAWDWTHHEYRVEPEPEKKAPAPAQTLYAAVHIDDGRMYAVEADPAVAEDICKHSKNYRVVKYVPEGVEPEYFKDYKVGDYAKAVSIKHTQERHMEDSNMFPLVGTVMEVCRVLDKDGDVFLESEDGESWFWDHRDLIPACKP
jgi:hypothetical protein